MGGGLLLASSPWLSTFAEVDHTINYKVRLGIIGPGSRGCFLLNFIQKNPKVEIVGICDIYQKSIDNALKIAPKAKVYKDYRALLDSNEINAVIITTPLFLHKEMAIAAMDAGKHVFCEKALAMNVKDCWQMYMKHKATGKIFFTGQQRLFDPRYIKVMEMIHTGVFGNIEGIHTFWYRNGDWRRNVPSPELERLINWRLYKEYSCGLMTELGCHQLQIGSWAMRAIPNKVMGHGAITHWKDGRDVDDNISCIYIFDNGVKLTFDSVISNQFYGLEEQILGNLGTVEPEKGKFYFEKTPPAPGFLQLLNQIENQLFDAIPFAGSSWEPETMKNNKGEYILGERPRTDGTSLLLDAYIEAVIIGKQPQNIAEEGYYASALTLLGYQAIEEERIITFPDEFKLDYLNHKNTQI